MKLLSMFLIFLNFLLAFVGAVAGSPTWVPLFNIVAGSWLAYVTAKNWDYI